MENEATYALYEKYSKPDGMNIHFLGTGKSARYFANFVPKATPYADDAPDMLLKINNEAIIIEHFEFDNYHVGRKGSLGRQETARIRRNYKFVDEAKEGILFSDQINGKGSFRNLITNLCHNFKTHYDRIPKYKENLRRYGLIDDLTQVKVMFLIEDVSPLGSMVIDGDIQKHINVLLCKEFLDLFKNAFDLDYILSCSFVAGRSCVWFADRNEIEEYYQNAVDYEQMAFLDFDVQVTGFKINYPQGNSNEKCSCSDDFRTREPL